MVQRIRGFLDDEGGQALAETALLLTFVFLVCVIAVTQFGAEVQGMYERFVDAYPG